MKKIRTVLVIDDDPINNVICKTLIHTLHFSEVVHSFVRAKEALEYLKDAIENQPDKIPQVIFLDVNMPEMDGWEFLEEYDKLPTDFKENCQLYMLSSSVNREDMRKSEHYKYIRDFIQKPLSPVSLEDVQNSFNTEQKAQD
ncbi:MAG: response regulator [Thermoflexibacter sp.]